MKPPSNACAQRYESRLITPMQYSISHCYYNEKMNTRRLLIALAPLSCQRMPIGMGRTSASIIEIL
jgi:hypothetical protein